MIKRSVEKPDPVSLQKMLKYPNFEDWYPSGKFQLFDIFLVSEGSLGPKPPTYPALARFVYFKVSGCFGPLSNCFQTNLSVISKADSCLLTALKINISRKRQYLNEIKSLAA